MAGAFAAFRLPWLLFPLISGAVADRVDRRIAITIADVSRAVILAGLVVAVAGGWMGLPVLYAAAFLLATAETLADAAREAFVPALVTKEHLSTANSRLVVVELIGNQFVGPVIGGLLFALAASAPFALNAVTFAAAAALVAMIPGRYRADRGSDPTTVARDIAEGLRWLLRHRVLRTLAIAAGITNLAGMMVVGIFVLYAQDVLGLGEVGYGLLLAVMGVGGLAGGLLAPRLGTNIGEARSLAVSTWLLIVSVLVFVFTASAPLASVALALVGAGIGIWNVNAISLRQELSPDALRGRVASVARLMAWGTQPIGALLGGVIATAYGLRAPFLATAVLFIAQLALISVLVTSRSVADARAVAAG